MACIGKLVLDVWVGRLKIQDLKMTDQIVARENARQKNSMQLL